MGKKLNAIKDLQKKDKNIVVDKTFGLKNKGKSKKVQQFVAQVGQQKGDAKADAMKQQRKANKAEALQAEMEMKALFSEGLSITVKKKDMHAKKGPAPAGGGGGGGAGPGDHYDDAWAEAQLEKEGGAGIMEERIEVLREELRQRLKAEGKKGTPVTSETFAAWKKAKADRVLAEKMATAKAAEIKKKSMKNGGALSGRDLYLLQQSLFVDDAEAVARDEYVVQHEVEEDDDDYDENGLCLKKHDEEEEEEAMDPTMDPTMIKALDASLYLGDADADDDLDLEDLEDD